MKTGTEPYNDPVGVLLCAAMDIREAHKPDADGGCPGAEYCSEDLAGGCLPYRTAEKVLDMWADRSYLLSTGTADQDRSDVMWTELDHRRAATDPRSDQPEPATQAMNPITTPRRRSRGSKTGQEYPPLQRKE